MTKKVYSFPTCESLKISHFKEAVRCIRFLNKVTDAKKDVTTSDLLGYLYEVTDHYLRDFKCQIKCIYGHGK